MFTESRWLKINPESMVDMDCLSICSSYDSDVNTVDLHSWSHILEKAKLCVPSSQGINRYIKLDIAVAQFHSDNPPIHLSHLISTEGIQSDIMISVGKEKVKSACILLLIFALFFLDSFSYFVSQQAYFNPIVWSSVSDREGHRRTRMCRFLHLVMCKTHLRSRKFSMLFWQFNLMNIN